MPMLDEDEYRHILELYVACAESAKQKRAAASARRPSLDELFEPVRKEYERMTGVADCHHNAIMHHRIVEYGPPCQVCGKPLRTARACFCAACGAPVTRTE